MSIVAAHPPAEPETSADLDVGSLLDLALAMTRLIDMLDRIASDLHLVRAEVIAEAAESVPQTRIAQHVRLSGPRISQIIRTVRSRVRRAAA